ncbi:MAG: hypothetical protein UDM08_05470 [Eggerthellaceae bacterium]|nr:hypothetical protein [Eggerthellaceae bacterium]
MLEVRTSGRGQVNRHTHPKRSLWKRIYVSLLLFIMPLLLKMFGLSKKVRSEGAYLGEGFILRLTISGFSQNRSLRFSRNSWHGCSTNEKPTLTITFRDLDYAYDIFSGGITLKEGLSARLFTTHGPNDKGVSVTYLFTVILKTFFFWRSAYRRY